jgi:hypothetical protein
MSLKTFYDRFLLDVNERTAFAMVVTNSTALLESGRPTRSKTLFLG